MYGASCPLCDQFDVDLSRIETELEFLLENMPRIEKDSREGRRVYGEFCRVEEALDRIEAEYYAHRNTALLHQLEDRAVLN